MPAENNLLLYYNLGLQWTSNNRPHRLSVRKYIDIYCIELICLMLQKLSVLLKLLMYLLSFTAFFVTTKKMYSKQKDECY